MKRLRPQTFLRVVFLFLFLFSVPRDVTFALPPPDLLFSIPQIILNALGAIAASLVVLFGTLITFWRQMTASRIGRVSLYGVGALTVMVILISAGAFYSDWKLQSWKQEIDGEMRALWESYGPIYSAISERDARGMLSTTATTGPWTTFADATAGTEYIIVDIRDSYPYELGRIPGSTHIRLAELLRGEWKDIEAYKNKPVLLVCYLGTTGAIASQFLTSQGFTNLYQLEGGVTESVFRDPNLPFEGIAYLPYDARAVERLSLADAQTYTENGARVIDLRFPNRYEEAVDLPVSYQLFREQMTQEEINNFVSQLPAYRDYLILCEGDASCYSGEMLLYDLDNGGRTGVGMFNVLTPDGERIQGRPAT